MLNFFGISIEALRIGGGFAVAAAGWYMLNEPHVPASEAPQPGGDLPSLMASAFFPLAVPLTVGPGTIAAGIALYANRPSGAREYVLTTVVSFAVAALVACVIWQTYSRATLLARSLGAEGTKVAVRISAFLLLCIGVQIMLTGFSEFLQSIAARGR
ncbi:MarC family protein [Dyella sp. M7H15-1]|uniref:MarC family protein n=1 Tax=Dyella sp. M7H15-1 TaxID=2501295 RepID=UPI00197AA983|nr:MarC family protein [Dyella sp. M7H15-1]